MNRKEAAIITAYTGILIGNPSTFHKYAEGIMGRPIHTLEMSSKEFWEELKVVCKDDFISIHKELTF